MLGQERDRRVRCPRTGILREDFGHLRPVLIAAALLIQPTQWLADDRRVVDHVVDLVHLLSGTRLRYDKRIICPYASEQHNAQQVEWAKAHREVLTLNRELIVWQVQP